MSTYWVHIKGRNGMIYADGRFFKLPSFFMKTFLVNEGYFSKCSTFFLCFNCQFVIPFSSNVCCMLMCVCVIPISCWKLSPLAAAIFSLFVVNRMMLWLLAF